MTTFCGYALNVDGSATQFLRNSVPASPLLAKNSSPNCFLNAQTQGFKSSLFIHFQKKNPSFWMGFLLEVAIGFEPMNQGFADPRLTTWLCHHIKFDKNRTQETGRILCPVFYGADDEARTRYLHLGKVALYQMSYIRIQIGASDRNRTNDTRIFSPLLYQLSYRGKKWRPGTGSNRRPLA